MFYGGPPKIPHARLSFREKLRKFSEFGEIWKLVRNYRGLLLAANLIAVLSALLGLVYPLFIRSVVDDVFLGSLSVGLLSVYFLCYAVLIGLEQLASYLNIFLMLKVSKRVLRDFRIRAADRVIRFPLRYYESTEVGSITAKVCQDVEAVDAMIVQLSTNSLPSAVLVVVGIALGCHFSVELTLLTLTVLPLSIIISYKLHGRMRLLAEEERQRIENFSARLTSSLTGIRILKAFRQEERESGNLKNAAEEIAEKGVRNWSFVELFHHVVHFTIGLGRVAALWYAGYLVCTGRLTVGQFSGFGSLWFILMRPFFMILRTWTQVPSGLAALGRVKSLIDEPIEMQQNGALRVPEKIAGAVVFENVTFAYDDKGPAMQGVSFAAEPGRTVAIVGQSGAGKTTFANLLMGFYFPQEGRVLVDGVDVREWNLHALREEIGMVLQDNLLFNDTIRENVRYGKHDATDAEIWAALKTADAFDFVDSLKDGIGTVVGVGGMKLSGGQKQRLAIARAIVKNPRIILFDEATSHLDSLAEREIQKAMLKISAGRTTFIIAHRLSTIAHADMIMVFDGGRLAEAGTHDELLACDGVYRKLHDAQVYRFDDGEVIAIEKD